MPEDEGPEEAPPALLEALRGRMAVVSSAGAPFRRRGTPLGHGRGGEAYRRFDGGRNLEEVRKEVREFSRWLETSWEELGPLGKMFRVLLLVGGGLPFLFNLGLAIAIWWLLDPSNFAERALAIGAIAALVNTLALQVRAFSRLVIRLGYLLSGVDGNAP